MSKTQKNEDLVVLGFPCCIIISQQEIRSGIMPIPLCFFKINFNITAVVGKTTEVVLLTAQLTTSLPS